jgi:uncharacterized protein YcfJ
MTKRDITKEVVKILVGTAVGAIIDKTIVTLLPSAGKYKAAEMAGMFTGWYVTNTYQEKIESLVDRFYDKREAR